MSVPDAFQADASSTTSALPSRIWLWLPQVKAVQIGTDLPLDVEAAVHGALELLLQLSDFSAELLPLAQELALATICSPRAMNVRRECHNLRAVDIRADEPAVFGKAQLLIAQQRELVGRRIAQGQVVSC